MNTKLILAGVALCAASALLTVQAVSAQEGGPPPSAGTKIAEGLMNTIGSTIGPDGALYVAEAGNGGDIATTPPPDAPADEPAPTFGLSGRVSRIDPETGERTTAGSGIGSLGFAEGAGGAVDVAFIGTTMYVLTTGSADVYGQEDWPNGIYRVDGSDVNLVANLSEFNDDNPVDFPDAGPGGNPFALDVRGTDFYVTDGNYNRVLRVNSTNGAVSILTSFDNVVPTGLEASGTGPLHLTQFSSFPHTPEKSFLVAIGIPSGSTNTVAGGYSQLIDVENGPGGGTFVLQFGDTFLSEDGDPFTGKILSLNGSVLSPKVVGFMLPTSLDFSGDTAYVTTLLGEVWQIENFSAVQAPAPEPTAAPTTAPPVATATRPTGVVAPNTGSGPDDGSSGNMLMLALVIGALGVATGGAAFATKRG